MNTSKLRAYLKRKGFREDRRMDGDFFDKERIFVSIKESGIYATSATQPCPIFKGKYQVSDGAQFDCEEDAIDWLDASYFNPNPLMAHFIRSRKKCFRHVKAGGTTWTLGLS